MSRARDVIVRQPGQNRWASYSRLDTVANNIGGVGRINRALLMPVSY